MAKDPAFLWYPGDYLAGTTELNFEEKGAYVELLNKQFEHGGPMSIDKIKRILRDSFDRVWPALVDKFRTDEAGNFFNQRLEDERLKRKNFTESRRNNRKPKISVTYVEDLKNTTESYVETYVEHMENGNRDINENTNTDKKVKKKNKVEPENLSFPFASDEFNKAWSKWHSYRQEIKKPYRSKLSEQAALTKLGTFKETVAIQMIENSIENQWQGLFELKDFKNDRTATKGTSTPASAIQRPGKSFR
jgi:uncharacterized protein YdaU (DUF1376 family)